MMIKRPSQYRRHHKVQPVAWAVYVISNAHDKIIEVFLENVASTEDEIVSEYPDCTVTRVLNDDLSFEDAAKAVRWLQSAYELGPARHTNKNNQQNPFWIDVHPPGDKNRYCPEMGFGVLRK